MPIAPTLIIGLGGTGSQIVEKVYDKVRETGASQSDRISYVVFDTDINDLADIRRRSPGIKTVQTSTRSTVGEYLNINTNARDNWFPVNEMLNRKTLTEGAAQVRAISRLAFDTTLKGGNLEPLHKGIDHLFRIDKDQQEQALRIIIVSSLAGGTGSGLILPVAMYLSQYLRATYPKIRAITRGFFIQPDVFDSVIKAEEERRNLRVNAYAAVRELDAFLMKGDNTLDERYQSLRFEFPVIDGDGVEEVVAMPYDFCFLFDAISTRGGSLESFSSYKDHAATCIYTLSLGPMSKRSNSREDNVLREVIKNDGRNRYVGAGASRLVYPWMHVRDYVAYKWADQSLSAQWLTFDEQIKGLREARARQRENGFAVKDIDTGKEFTALLDAAAGGKDPFARTMRSQCLIFDEDGLFEVGTRWAEYVTALKGHVEHEAQDANDDSLKRNVLGQVAQLSESTDPEDYAAAYYELKRFHALVERRVEEVSGIVGYSLFRAENSSITKDRHPHQLETYLREAASSSFVHPVAARYFLYQTLEMLKAERQRMKIELDNTVKYFERFESGQFQNPKDGEPQTPAQWASDRKKPFSEKIRRSKPGSDLKSMQEAFQNYVQRVDRLRMQSVYFKVLEEAVIYVTGMCKAFENFFASLEGNLNKLKSDVEMHRTKYDDLKGSTTRYVLASSESLDFLYRGMPYSGGVIGIDSELAEDIYLQVRAYHMLKEGKELNHFQSVYERQMLGYFRNQVDDRYRAQLELDILTALEKEFLARNGKGNESGVEHYVIAEIEKVKLLAAPFLEQPVGEERHPIMACAYNPLLEGKSDPRRKALVSEHLGNYGGQEDEEIDPQEILFYNAIYAIRARDLSKFSAQRVDGTDKRPAGSYYKAYFQLVNKIKPSVSETRVITPHIDRRWHTVAALPDLDDNNQARQLYDIHSAFFSGLALGVIRREVMNGDRMVYRYFPWRDLAQDMVVSNGTPCDLFYEVLDSLTISPLAIKDVSSAVERRLQGFLENANVATFSASPLGEALRNGLKLPELQNVVPALTGKQYSFLDVPTFLALSAPHQEMSDAQLRHFSADILAFIAEQVEQVNEAQDVNSELETIIRIAVERYREHCPIYLEAAGDAFSTRIRTILRPVIEFLDDRQIRDLSKSVEDFEQSLSAQ